MSAAVAPRTAVSPARARARVRRRGRVAGVVLALALVVLSCVSLSVGEDHIAIADVLRALVGAGDPGDEIVIRELRLPRLLTGLLVGAGFGLSGAIYQAVTRNALASPDLLGVSQGASVVAILLITAADASFALRYAGAMGGALVAGVLIYVLAYRDGLAPYRFVLVGISLGLMFNALTLIVIARADLTGASQATVWLTGSISSSGWETVRPTALTLAVVLPLALLLAQRLRVLQLGDELGQVLGLGVERTRLLLLATGTVLVGAGTAAAGPVTFVAFMAGPIARRLCDQPLALVPSALVGALLVVAGDFAGSQWFGDTEIPVGIVTGILGAPFLLWLLTRSGRPGSAT